MSKIAIKAEGLSKAYQLGEFSTGTISRDIERWWALLRGKEDPFLRIGETNDRTSKGSSDIVWSLKDINFEINQGDAVGVIGRNGAGKSTLLKVLSRVTTPTTGSVKVKGRIASLLEVGTGFHPELTGRENIFLNGAILGMRKHEIRKHFDAIVDFAGVERYIDTPVKRYSSGMYVRLAFAVAAHLESEILIVDEVLAVGDAEFQKKCLGKMKDVSGNEGRTVLFVSHNMESVSRLCNTGIYLKNGQVQSNGEVNSVISQYLTVEAGITTSRTYDHQDPTEGILLQKVRVIDERFEELPNARLDERVGIEITYEVVSESAFTHSINIFNETGLHVFTAQDLTGAPVQFRKEKGRHVATAWIPANLLKEGSYRVSVAAIRYNPFHIIFHHMDVVGFTAYEGVTEDGLRKFYSEHIPGVVLPQIDWTFSTVR
jgi:lipopolysaccharide transport system ATP-binding protein